MKYGLSKKLGVTLLIAAAVSVAIYFPDLWLPTLISQTPSQYTQEYIQGQDQGLYPEVFTYASYHCPPGSDTDTRSCSPGQCCTSQPSQTSDTCTYPMCGTCTASAPACPDPADHSACADCTTVCTSGTNCGCRLGVGVGSDVWCDTDADQTNFNTCSSCSCSGCSYPACLRSNQGFDLDGDGCDGGPGSVASSCDCNDSNALIAYSACGSPINSLCDCDPGTGYDGVYAAQGATELTNCNCSSSPCDFTIDADCWCNNGRDDDCDGFTDYWDSDCPIANASNNLFVKDGEEWPLLGGPNSGSRISYLYNGVWILDTNSTLVIHPNAVLSVDKNVGIVLQGPTNEVILCVTGDPAPCPGGNVGDAPGEIRFH